MRGYSIVAALCEEIAFWENAEDSANPDAEILAALRPAMATIPGALLLAISSPYARRCELWRAYERNYGKDSPVLAWQADTRSMNPAVDPAVIAKAYDEDESRAEAEYGAQFRRAVENFLTDIAAIVAALNCVLAGKRSRRPWCRTDWSFRPPAGSNIAPLWIRAAAVRTVSHWPSAAGSKTGRCSMWPGKCARRSRPTKWCRILRRAAVLRVAGGAGGLLRGPVADRTLSAPRGHLSPQRVEYTESYLIKGVPDAG